MIDDESLLPAGLPGSNGPAGSPTRHDEGPLVEAIVVLHVVVKGAAAVDLLEWYVLRHVLFQIRLRHFEAACHRVLPIDWCKEGVLLDLISSTLARTKALIGVSVEE